MVWIWLGKHQQLGIRVLHVIKLRKQTNSLALCVYMYNLAYITGSLSFHWESNYH